MNCPLCLDQVLEPYIRSGIEIDVCPSCRGVWLDRGELEKLAVEEPADIALGSAASSSDRHDAPSGAKRKAPKSKKSKRRKGFADRLGDLLEDALDL